MQPMIYRPASEVTGLRAGDVIVSSSGVDITVLDIQVEGFHLPTPTVFVRYAYDNNGHKGTERVPLSQFKNHINS